LINDLGRTLVSAIDPVDPSTVGLSPTDRVDDPVLPAAGWSEPLPSFEELRVQAYRLLGEAADRLRSGYQPGTGPCGGAVGAVCQAFAAIGAARNALEDVVLVQAHARRRVPPR
jgi:hypothetical protein